MSGETYGSRFTDGGYQAPRTNAVSLTRGRPLRSLRWLIGSARVTLELVPFEGGRPELFEVALQSNDIVAGHSVYVPCMLRGEQLAREAFALTALELDAGRLPRDVVVPAGTRVGW